MEKFKVGIVGADTRMGQELVRRLLTHPFVEVAAASSSAYAGRPINEVCPQLMGLTSLTLVGEQEVIARADVVFNADTSFNSQELGALCIKNRCVFIDLSDEFRLSNEADFKAYSGEDFSYAGLHEAAIYGLPELMRDQMLGKVLIANPGAAATAAALALIPPVLDGLISCDGIAINAAISAADAPGLSRPAREFGSAANNIALGPDGTIDRYEIEQLLTIAAGKNVRITYAPTTVCASRGVLVSCFVRTQLAASEKTLTNSLVKLYNSERFVRILPPGAAPSTTAVYGTNCCDIGVRCFERTGTAVITAALDTLGKGSVGQAIQNMNTLLSLPEHIALVSSPQ